MRTWGSDEPEIPLAGGDVTEGVVRVGETVRRPVGPHSPLVHVVLRHLESVGFDGAPRLLGVDDRGREVLTYVLGEVAGRPWPEWVGLEERAASVARLVRRLDDAMVPLGLPAQVRPRPEPAGRPGPAPSYVGHLDITPENTVFRDGVAVALVDFDLAGPASPLDEVANLLLWWGGWVPEQDRDPSQVQVDPAARGRLLVDAYGLVPDLRPLVVPFAVWAAGRSWQRMHDNARDLGGGWARMWDEGAGDQILRRREWLLAAGPDLASALQG